MLFAHTYVLTHAHPILNVFGIVKISANCNSLLNGLNLNVSFLHMIAYKIVSHPMHSMFD